MIKDLVFFQIICFLLTGPLGLKLIRDTFLAMAGSCSCKSPD